MRNKEKWKPGKYIIKNDSFEINPEYKDKLSSSYIPINIAKSIYPKLLKKYLKGKMLDLGCGNVPYYGYYKNFVDENICVDWENTLHKNEFLDCVCDISQKLPFKDCEFDSILSSAVLEHIYNPQSLIQECNRILKPGGYLIMSSNFSYWEHEAPFDYLRHTQYFFRRAAEENGFVIQELHKNGDGLCSIADMARKIYFRNKKCHKDLLFKLLFYLTDYLVHKYYFTKQESILPEQPLGYIVVMRKL